VIAEKKKYEIIKPQPGYQEKALSNSADILIGGAAAGVGKTYTLLLDPIRYINRIKGFGGVIFRRTTTQIRNEGGLWDTSVGLYPHIQGYPKESYLEWSFKYGNQIKFSHLEHEKNILDWQGAQIPFIGFDELTHFSRKMFFYLLSRNRSVCGVKPYVRATCNPDPESWVAEFIGWWIDQETGYAIPERDGIVRYLVVDGENYIWGDTEAEVIEKASYLIQPLVEKSGIDPKEFIKSVSFVSGNIYDNKELLKVNPGYLANLLSQDEATKASLLHSNWKAVLSNLDLYDYHAFAGMFDNLYDVDTEGEYITADIALEGSNKLVIGAWKGFELVNIEIIDKSDGKQVVEGISAVAEYHKVQNRNIAYDNDGVGGFVKGYIAGAAPFNGGIPALEVTDPASGKKIKENYYNLKTQCFYRSAKNVNAGKYKISKHVANKMYDDKMTVKQRFMYERKAIKRDKIDNDGKLRIISKAEMKAKLNGESPDLMDMLMMRELFELKPKRKLVYSY
jgi:hypothetical protein